MNLLRLSPGSVIMHPRQYFDMRYGRILLSLRIFCIMDPPWPLCFNSMITSLSSAQLMPVRGFSKTSPVSMVMRSVLALSTRVMRLKPVLSDGVMFEATYGEWSEMNACVDSLSIHDDGSSMLMRFLMERA